MSVRKGALGPVAVLLGLVLLGPTLEAGTFAGVLQDHLGLAQSYEQEVERLNTLIIQQQQLYGNYRQRFYINQQATPSVRIREAGKRSRAVIGRAVALQRELLAFAEWHRARAKHLGYFLPRR